MQKLVEPLEFFLRGEKFMFHENPLFHIWAFRIEF